MMEENERILLIALVIAAFTFYAANIDFGSPIRKDSYIYILKAQEIARGDLSPMLTHAIGWPAAMAPFILAGGTLLEKMAVARLLSAAWAALLLVPLYLIARRHMGTLESLAAASLAAFSYMLTGSAVSGLSEPLFAFTMLSALYFAMEKKPMAAGALAGLAWMIRPNGFIVLLLCMIFDHRRQSLLRMALLFALVSLPFLLFRAAQFGSPLDYGFNTDLMADSFDEAVMGPALGAREGDWAGRIFFGATDMPYKLVVENLLPLVAVPFFLLGAAQKRFRPVAACIGIWLLMLVLPWELFPTTRLLYPILPLMLLVTAGGIASAVKGSARPDTYLFLIAVMIAVWPVLVTGVWPDAPTAPQSQDWVVWAASNLRGEVISTAGGIDLITMNLPDASVGGHGLNDLYAPSTGLHIVQLPRIPERCYDYAIVPAGQHAGEAVYRDASVTIYRPDCLLLA